MTQAADANAPEAPGEARPRLMLVDDDDAVRVPLGYLLRSTGFAVEEARNGRECLGKLSDGGGADLVLLDIEMPVMDGMRTLAALHRHPTLRDTPVLMVSGHASRENVQRALSLGARGFVVKQGLDPKALIERVRKTLPAPRASGGEKPAGPAAAPTPAPGPVPTAAPEFDAPALRRRIEAIGQVDRDAARAAMAVVEPPSVMPAIRGEVLRLVEGGAAGAELASLCEQDPGVLVHLLARANRTGAGRGGVADAETALSGLEKGPLAELVKGLTAAGHEPAEELRPWFRGWWRHAVATARVAAALAPAIKLPPALLRSAGMLHDIGRLLLLAGPLSSKLREVYDVARNTILPVAYAEGTLLGLNHRQVGAEFCRRHGLPASLANVCEWHDSADAPRARLHERDLRLVAAVCAAGQIAKAAGYGSLPNDELLPAPDAMAAAVAERQLAIDRALAEVETLCAWRGAAPAAATGHAAVALAGVAAVFVSPAAGPSNPFQRVLSRAGAAVAAYTQIKDAAGAGGAPPDIAVIDLTAASLTLAIPALKRVDGSPALAKVPRLVLARRLEEPEERLAHAGVAAHVYATPIRINSLLQAVRRLTGQEDPRGNLMP